VSARCAQAECDLAPQTIGRACDENNFRRARWFRWLRVREGRSRKQQHCELRYNGEVQRLFHDGFLRASDVISNERLAVRFVNTNWPVAQTGCAIEIILLERSMGLFWDLYQQSQLSDHSERAGTLEVRVANLEKELRQTQVLLRAVIGRLEEKLGTDLDHDGKVG